MKEMFIIFKLRYGNLQNNLEFYCRKSIKKKTLHALHWIYVLFSITPV